MTARKTLFDRSSGEFQWKEYFLVPIKGSQGLLAEVKFVKVRWSMNDHVTLMFHDGQQERTVVFGSHADWGHVGRRLAKLIGCEFKESEQ